MFLKNKMNVTLLMHALIMKKLDMSLDLDLSHFL